MPGSTGMRCVQRSNLDARNALQLHLKCKFALTSICDKKRHKESPSFITKHYKICLLALTNWWISVMSVIQRSIGNIWTKVHHNSSVMGTQKNLNWGSTYPALHFESKRKQMLVTSKNTSATSGCTFYGFKMFLTYFHCHMHLQWHVSVASGCTFSASHDLSNMLFFSTLFAGPGMCYLRLHFRILWYNEHVFSFWTKLQRLVSATSDSTFHDLGSFWRIFIYNFCSQREVSATWEERAQFALVVYLGVTNICFPFDPKCRLG